MKDKLLNFLIVFLLTILIVNTFFNDKKTSDVSGITINFESNSYTIPTSPVLNIINNTTNIVRINSCKDIVVNYAWDNLTLNNDFCRDIDIWPTKTEKISYDSVYKTFLNPGQYTFKTKIDNKEYLNQVNIENKWFFWKLFTGLFYAPLYNLTALFIQIFDYSFWWAIVVITILLRLVLVYPQHKMMVSQRKLQAIQPKIKEIQDKFKWNQQMLWVELMKLYKEEWVNPFGSCWLLLIQMPILLVIYNIFIWINTHSNTFYLYTSLSSFQLDSIAHNFLWIDVMWIKWTTGIFLAITIAVLQFLQVKLSLAQNKPATWVVLEKKSAKDDYQSFMPDQELLNKFMLYWLPAMVWVFTYSLLAWVWIYWGISTTFTIFQQLIVNKIVKK